MSEDTRRKISQALQGYKHTPEAIERMRQSCKGRILTPEHIEKIRQAGIGRKHTPETIAKKKLWKPSPEQVEKNRQSKIGVSRPPDVIEKMRNRKRTPEEDRKIKQTHISKLYQKILNNPDKFYGVENTGKTWRIRINIDGSKVKIGSFPTQLEAFEAYKKVVFARYSELTGTIIKI